MTISLKEYDLHERHCCAEHGCKYGDKDCPVVNRKTTQLHYCEDCVPEKLDYGQDDEALSPDENIIKDLEAKIKKLKSAVKVNPKRCTCHEGDYWRMKGAFYCGQCGGVLTTKYKE